MVTIPESYRHIAFDTIGSTNQHALSLALKGEAGNLWVTAGEQTSGVGRRGRAWSSEPGNLFASLLLIDPAPMRGIGHLPLLTATAVHRAVEDVMPPHVRARLRIKWPNDLLWGDSKICGILLENMPLGDGRQAVVIGIGVNCRKHPDKTEGLSAADLSQTSGYDVAPESLFERLAAHMAERLSVWDRGNGLGLIREDWLYRARGVGERVVVRLPNEEIEGLFERLDESGGLVLRLADGSDRVIYAGDVFWPSVTH
ncbi:BirA family transcriptional regulator, biotin operon repressor / biotin-[acetyl-CoA-carboxylase] ligase [Cohaesibacter sp. ES.047]|uniref:biotin--[acetyl-CoA-carboxylase] ligase n=1 Tax=Cohaesibacter sp. ES.047 TaxID=1798205 RepID=UPI000BB991FB|nr:biotin--[acetyl-CoA-carboxylase] ligase [Cohaesibacter sp. ES.047]SNY93725.1 BirA family transcriptional regulator, biotin operon repressor / biotin-[acetyl-CoA-carboxylase] ligase [Cohaesibacter sp. ES.047]